MSIAMLMAMASCSSSDDAVEEIKEESKLVPMTFTATQESNVGTRAELNNSNGVDWQTSDNISVFDGQDNWEFTLTGDATEGKFSGTASSEATSFTAVYPYTDGAQLESTGSVSGITLPAEQTATAGSFDPKAALMMAVSTAENKNKLDFKNVVSLVKVTTEFACKKIVLSANENIAGTGTLTYNNGEPSIALDQDQSKTITLKPATDGGEIAAGTYYIAICPQTLTGFSISFINSADTKAYTRTSTRNNIFNRSGIKNLGIFNEVDDTWTSTIESNGNVNASQQVDMGVFNIGGTNYRLIFTKSNLTKDGLAENEYDYGDYFAWGATSVWYSAINKNTNPWSITTLGGKSGGYISTNAPYYNDVKYTTGNTLEASDDAARQILDGDWQIPTQAIWQALVGISTKGWDSGYKFTNNGQTLFLPAAGYVSRASFSGVGSYGYYWSGTAYSSTDACYLGFDFGGEVYAQFGHRRYYGCPVRPVRLVAVD